MAFGGQLHVYAVPTVRVKVGKTFKRRVDAAALATLMRFLAGLGVDRAITENVNGWSRPKSRRGAKGKATGEDAGGQSASAAFAFGKVAGQLEQALADNNIPTISVAPARWKLAMGLRGADKHASRVLAAQLYPHAAQLFARAKDDGAAEAALLIRYLKAQHLPA